MIDVVTARSYANEIVSLQAEISRTNKRLNELRKQKREDGEALAEYMENRGLTEFQGIKLKSIKPKARRKAKPKSERKKDAIAFFTKLGANNPNDLWEQFQVTQQN